MTTDAQIYANKEEALNKCLVLWKTISAAGFSFKQRAYSELRLSPDLNYCPACEFATQSLKLSGDQWDIKTKFCHACPIWTPKSNTDEFMCEYHDDSPYKAWIKAREEGMFLAREKAAHKMVELITYKLKEC